MKFWGPDNPLAKVWESSARGYFDLLETMTGHHYHDNRITKKADAQYLEECYSTRYGKDGNDIMGRLVTSPDFNGNEKPGEAEDFFPGMEYSIPLSFYFVRRVFEEETPADSYDIFTNDIQMFGKKTDMTITRIPTRHFLENFVEPYLEEIRALDAQNIISFDQPDDGDDHHDNEAAL